MRRAWLVAGLGADLAAPGLGDAVAAASGTAARRPPRLIRVFLPDGPIPAGG